MVKRANLPPVYFWKIGSKMHPRGPARRWVSRLARLKPRKIKEKGGLAGPKAGWPASVRPKILKKLKKSDLICFDFFF